MSDVSTVSVGPFRVADINREDTVGSLVALACGPGRERAVTGYALHVAGLNARTDPAFVAAMNGADLVYADGGSVVWLAHRSGAHRLERAPTTDIGWDVLRGVARALGRPARVALVGGPPGLARRAAGALSSAGVAESVLIAHGFHDEWADHVRRVREANPDLVLVGMGAPREMLWSSRWQPEIGRGLVLTCGGWFGFLAGTEHRAPAVIRRPGVEWISRVAQQPLRLGPRYVRGAVVTASMAQSLHRSAAATHRRPHLPEPDRPDRLAAS